jgi:hypothetical protein
MFLRWETGLGKYEKLIAEILSGKQDASFRFAEIDKLMGSFGFSKRIKGDHHIYYKGSIREIINMQPSGQVQRRIRSGK